MCHHTHLTSFEREKIFCFLAEGKSVTEIAHLLNRSKSTISRELRRNAATADQHMPYCPLTAQALYKQRREACRSHKRLEIFPKGKEITDISEDYIQRKYHELNLRPGKCLGCKTPYEVCFSKVLHLA